MFAEKSQPFAEIFADHFARRNAGKGEDNGQSEDSRRLLDHTCPPVHLEENEVDDNHQLAKGDEEMINGDVQALAPLMYVQQHRIGCPLVSAYSDADNEHNPQIQDEGIFVVEKEK